MKTTKTQIFRGLYKRVLKPILFRIDPESVHNLFSDLGCLLGKTRVGRKITDLLFNYSQASLEQNLLGIGFENPVGLAAGFDKDAKLIDIARNVGFGFSQVGTVTLKPYKGNPKPRIYRLPASKAAVVYFGLKNIGVEKIMQKIRKRKVMDFPLSISVGKTNAKYTSGEKAGIQDYKDCLARLVEEEIGDFYTINISCPNTFGGEPFTSPGKLKALLDSLSKVSTAKPLLLKMPINLSWEEFRKLLDIALEYEISGVVIGNLNKDRGDDSIKENIPESIKGGISGKPCEELANVLISKTYQYCGNKLVIIGVGGIFSAEDAYEKIKRGASLVSLITGMVYEGPQLIGEINRGIAELLEKDGADSVADAVGTYHN